MSKFVCVLALGTLVGCGVEDEPQVGVTTSTLLKCPDPEDCILTNGSGTYVEEFGYAGIGPNSFMITRFVNNPASQGTPPSVSIEGRYQPPGSQDVIPSVGTIDHAIYNGQSWDVRAVSETLTVPTWTLHNASSGTVLVIASDIVNMKLVVALRDDSGNELYTLAFSNYVASPVPGPSGVVVQPVDMQWKVAFTSDALKQYCFRGPNPFPYGSMANDPVVFQQNIVMNAINADIVNRDDAYVTLSCRHGGPATAAWWGYTYRSNGSNQAQTNVFDAALHMKRASYCGDASFYTHPITEIDVQDHFHIINDAMDPTTVEAVWGPAGALCVNMALRRHSSATFPFPGGPVFANTDCPPPGLTAIPDCVTWAQTHTLNGGLGILADQAVSPGP